MFGVSALVFIHQAVDAAPAAKSHGAWAMHDAMAVDNVVKITRIFVHM